MRKAGILVLIVSECWLGAEDFVRFSNKIRSWHLNVVWEYNGLGRPNCSGVHSLAASRKSRICCTSFADLKWGDTDHCHPDHRGVKLKCLTSVRKNPKSHGPSLSAPCAAFEEHHATFLACMKHAER